MAHKACTGLTKSLLAGSLAIGLAAAIAACASTSGPAATAGRSAASAGGGGAASGSPGNGGAAAGSGTATGGGAGGSGSAASNGGPASVPAVARTLICPPLSFDGPNTKQPLNQAIPAGFQAVAVVQCAPVGAIAPASLNYVRKEVAITGLGPLLAALRKPSAARNAVHPECLLPFMIMPRLALVGSDGAVIYPRIPVSVCGAPIPQVGASLAALHWIKLSITREPQRLPQQDPSVQGVLTPPPTVHPAS
jgi:hypothetical protein